jgi:hypothetical protein
LREVFEKNVPTSGRIWRPPHSGQAAPLAWSLMDWVTATSLRHVSQKYSYIGMASSVSGRM